MDRATKEALVGELKELFNSTSAVVLVDYRSLNAMDMVILRKKLHQSSSKVRVLKNTLAKIAAKGTPFEGLAEQLVDTRALIFSDQDPVGQAKTVLDFAKEHEALKIQGGLLLSQGRTTMLSAKDVEALAKLPSKEELIVKLLFLMQSPATQFVRTLKEVPAKFARVLSAIASSKR